MTIADFIEVLSMSGFSEIHIYDEDNDEPSWTGMGNEIPEEYEDSEVENEIHKQGFRRAEPLSVYLKNYTHISHDNFRNICVVYDLRFS